MATWLSQRKKNFLCSLFYILHYTCLNGVYFGLKYCVVCSPRLKQCSLLEPHQYTPTPVPLLVLDLSMYQTRPPLMFGVKPFCHSHFSGEMTVNGLCYTYLSQSTSVGWIHAPCSIPNIQEPLSNSQCQNGDMKQVPHSEHKILELLVNLILVVLLNVHALIIIFFT